MTLKERTAAISLAASLILAAAKLVVGLAIGSLALITDALHSCVDFFATGVTWMAVRVADKPADAEHPYGHGKFENIAALGEAALLLLLAGGVAVEAISRIRTDEAAAADQHHRDRRAFDRDRRQRLARAGAQEGRPADA